MITQAVVGPLLWVSALGLVLHIASVLGEDGTRSEPVAGVESPRSFGLMAIQIAYLDPVVHRCRELNRPAVGPSHPMGCEPHDLAEQAQRVAPTHRIAAHIPVEVDAAAVTDGVLVEPARLPGVTR
jgi:hypothetical protein